MTLVFFSFRGEYNGIEPTKEGPMFNNLLDSAVSRPRTRLCYTLPFAALLQTAAIATLVVWSLVNYAKLPELRLEKFFAPPPPVWLTSAPPPASKMNDGRMIPPAIPRVVRADDFTIPTEIPRSFTEHRDIPSLASVLPNLRNFFGPGSAGGPRLVSGATNLPEVAPPPPPVAVEKRDPVRVGGNVQSSKLIFRVEPVYPELARRARVAGMVVMQVTVDEQGLVSDTRVISGHQLLTGAAVEAVQQWRYSPTLLNGEAVPVIATVTVQFVLR